MSKEKRLPNSIPESDDDGYTVTRYISGKEGLYGPLRFTYRPVSSHRKAQFRDHVRDFTEEEALDALAQASAKQLVSWDAIDHMEQPLGKDWRSIRQLHPEQATLFFACVVYSTYAGDIDPEAKNTPAKPGWFSPPDEQLVEAEQKN